MKRISFLASLVTVALVAVPPMARGAGEKKTMVITGELVDAACFNSMGARGEAHRECAIKCAKMGIPVQVVDQATGEAYTLLVAAPAIADQQARTVRVTGKVFEKSHSIAPDKLEVQEGTTWKEVALPKAQ